MKTTLTFLFSLLIACFWNPLHAQNCTGDVIISSQTDVLNFNCIYISGNLIIEDDNDGVDPIVDLDPMYTPGLTVDGDVEVAGNPSLTTLIGLDGISSIGGDFAIVGNPVLYSSGIYDFQVGSIEGNVFVIDNAILTEISKLFFSLTTVGGEIAFVNNDALPSITGLNQLAGNITSLRIQGNEALTSMGDMPLLTGISIDMRITQNPSLSALPSIPLLTTLGRIIIIDCDQLTTINDFPNITSTGGIYLADNDGLTQTPYFPDLEVMTGWIDFESNPNLTTISPFPSLTSIEGSLRLVNCNAVNGYPPMENLTTLGQIFMINSAALTTLPSFTNVTGFTGSIQIYNTGLQDCCPLAILLAQSPNYLLLYDNQFGCNSWAEINPTPTIDCPAEQTIFTQPNSCEGIVSFSDPVPDSNCDYLNYELTLAKADGSVSTGPAFSGGAPTNFTLPLGDNTFTYTLQYEGLPEVTCSSVITVVDNEVPTLEQCTESFTVTLPNGATSVNVDLSDPFASDNCELTSFTAALYGPDGVLIFEAGGVPGAPFNYVLAEGDNTFVFTAIDASGNESVCTTIVSVVEADNEAPVFVECPGEYSLETTQIDPDVNDCGAEFTLPTPAVTDNIGVVSYVATVEFSSDIGFATIDVSNQDIATVWPIGLNYITYLATDGIGNQSTCITTVYVEDTTPPVFTNCGTNLTVEVDNDCSAELFFDLPTATDFCGIVDATVSIETPLQTFPEINLGIGATSVYLNLPSGISFVTYTVSDAYGNESSCTTVINVVDTIAPIFQDCGTEYVFSTDLGSAEAIVVLPYPALTDNCGINHFEIMVSYASGQVENFEGFGSQGEFNLPVGENTFLFTAFDTNWNVSTCEITVVVEDNEEPVIGTCSEFVELNADASCSAFFTYNIPTVTDNVGVVYQEYTLMSPNLADLNEEIDFGTLSLGFQLDIGEHLFEFRALDAAGNATSTLTTVSVIGNCNGESCPGDANVDGLVDGSDLLVLLGSFGCSGCTEADFNEDSSVDGADLLILLGAFGSSCI